MSTPGASREPGDARRERVRARYAAAADAVGAGRPPLCADATGAPATCGDGFGAGLYEPDDWAALPDLAAASSLGCGNPLAVAELATGETVLDLGSGGGLDVLLSARRVGPTGLAYGLDTTREMLDLARSNAAGAGVDNVEFLHGDIEAIPLPAASVDVVISNCVINLSTEKPTVFAEIFRVLRPGGRLGVCDVVTDDAARAEPAGCVAGALSIGDYRDGLAAAGFTDVTITPTHQVADATHAASIRATKPVPTPDECCGVTACCSDHEHPTDPAATLTEAKTRAGCGCVSRASPTGPGMLNGPSHPGTVPVLDDVPARRQAAGPRRGDLRSPPERRRVEEP